MDRIERIRERLAKEKPVRHSFERVFESVPSGPLGAVGGGNVAGFLGFLLVESGEVITSPIPGLTRPGFKKISHGVEVIEPGLQRHTVRVHAFSRDVAEFMAQYDSAPSNIGYITSDISIESVEEIDTEATYDTYEIKALIDRRPLE